MVQKELSSRTRGRPRSYDPQAVLAQVRDTFWKHGYSATSLDDLCAATGLNRPSLYGGFGDKRALYLAALEHSRAEMIASLKRGLAVPGSLRDSLTLVYSSATALYREGGEGQRGCFMIGTAVTESVADPQVRAVLDGAFGELDAAFAERLARELPPAADPAPLAQVATALLHTLAVRARAGAGEAALRGIYETGVELLCGACDLKPAR
jgi:AcrR family transcriptional regulator